MQALHVRADPARSVPVVGEGMSGAMIEDLMAAAEKHNAMRLTRAQALFETVAKTEGVPVVADPPAPTDGATLALQITEGDEEDTVAALSRLADMTVVPRPSQDEDLASLLETNAALLAGGRPVLVAPPAVTEQVGSRVLVAWNGSAEAARAVGGALPFLERAEHITVLSLNDCRSASRNDYCASARDLANSLAWRGLTAEVEELDTRTAVGPALLSAAETKGADLLVMGAYTHSRLWEMILGGATRHVLYHAGLPILMSH